MRRILQCPGKKISSFLLIDRGREETTDRSLEFDLVEELKWLKILPT
jgi:hypothetical protein